MQRQRRLLALIGPYRSGEILVAIEMRATRAREEGRGEELCDIVTGVVDVLSAVDPEICCPLRELFLARSKATQRGN